MKPLQYLVSYLVLVPVQGEQLLGDDLVDFDEVEEDDLLDEIPASVTGHVTVPGENLVPEEEEERLDSVQGEPAVVVLLEDCETNKSEDIFNEKEPSEIPQMKRSTRKKRTADPLSTKSPSVSLPIQQSLPTMYPCNVCAKEFANTSQRNGHMASHKKVTKKTTEASSVMSQPSATGSQFNCDQCDKTFPSVRSRASHRGRAHKVNQNQTSA